MFQELYLYTGTGDDRIFFAHNEGAKLENFDIECFCEKQNRSPCKAQ